MAIPNVSVKERNQGSIDFILPSGKGNEKKKKTRQIYTFLNIYLKMGLKEKYS